MKKLTFAILFLTLSLVLFSSCNKEKKTDEGLVDFIKDGKPFVMANTIQFYYLNDKNESLIDPEKPETLPSVYRTEKYPEQIVNGDKKDVYYDPQEKLYYFQTYIPGDMSKSNFAFYISCIGQIDRLKAFWKYTSNGCIGGNGVCAILMSLTYNDKLIYTREDPLYKKVFIKKAAGKTTVSLSRN